MQGLLRTHLLQWEAGLGNGVPPPRPHLVVPVACRHPAAADSLKDTVIFKNIGNY